MADEELAARAAPLRSLALAEITFGITQISTGGCRRLEGFAPKKVAIKSWLLSGREFDRSEGAAFLRSIPADASHRRDLKLQSYFKQSEMTANTVIRAWPPSIFGRVFSFFFRAPSFMLFPRRRRCSRRATRTILKRQGSF